MTRNLATGLLAVLAIAAQPATQPHLISLDVRDAPLGDVIYMLAVQSGKNIVADASTRPQKVTLRIRHLTFDAVLDVLARLRGLDVRREGRVYLIASRGANARRNSETVRLPAVRSPRPIIRLNVRVADVQLSEDQIKSAAPELGGSRGSRDGGPGFAFAKSAHEIDATVAGLSSAGRLKILAAWALAAPGDRAASLLIGQQYPVILGDTRNTHARLVDVGLRLRIRASVDTSGSVTSVLRTLYSATEGARDGSLVLGREFDATVRVARGQTIVLGGFLGDIDAQTVAKSPFLGETAVLGAVFRVRQPRRQSDGLLFLITPQVIESAPSARRAREGNRPQ